MNRRDMVITAVLMNAILLVALFATSKRGVVKNYAENYSEFSSETYDGLLSESFC